MKTNCISKDWILRSAPNVSSYRHIDLPHDYAISLPRNPNLEGGGSTGFYPGGVAHYIKFFTPDASAKIILDVDGAYQHARIIINRHEIAAHHHGYTPFLVDLTKYVRPGRSNKIDIITAAPPCTSRWYAGAGLYRDVFLWTGGPVRIEPRDVFVTTESITPEEAHITAHITVSSDLDATSSLVLEIQPKDGSQPAVTVSQSISVSAQEKTALSIPITIQDPLAWSPDSPQLYTLKATLTPEGSVAPDTTEIVFGIRTISASATTGLLLNGHPLKLRGGCLHHDHGVLGAVALPKADCRKLSRLKAVGFNAIRTAHYPPSRELLDLCDELGILVMDEAFDMWNIPKNYLDYSLWFNECCEADCASMVLRDRVHPCVISYSIGNEVPESSGHSRVCEITKQLTSLIKSLDPSRLVSISTYFMLNQPAFDPFEPLDYQEDFLKEFCEFDEQGHDQSWDHRTSPFFELVDICGYNYIYTRYEQDGKNHPNRIIWGSETHALNIFHSWHEVQRLSHVIGDFTWTAWDNLGEVGTGRSQWLRDGYLNRINLGEWPWRSCYQGDFNLIGSRRPQSYYRETVWTGQAPLVIFTTHPEHFGEIEGGTGWHWNDVLDSWTFPEQYLDCPVACELYSRADRVDWFLNGTLITSSTPVEYKHKITVPYQPGTLEAVAFSKDTEIGRTALQTVAQAARVMLSLEENTPLKADGRDLAYINVEITDRFGRRIPDSKAALHVSSLGGECLGIFSGDPKNEDVYTTPDCHAFEGRALIIMKASKPEKISVTVSSPNLAGASLSFDAIS